MIKCFECGKLWPDDYDATHCDCGLAIDENCFHHEEEPQAMSDELNEVAGGIYETLAEPLARRFGKAGALTFYSMMGEDVQNFWRGIAKQLIDHSKEWEPNRGSACILSQKESKRLAELPRIK